jgi:hypothetical protein
MHINFNISNVMQYKNRSKIVLLYENIVTVKQVQNQIENS